MHIVTTPETLKLAIAEFKQTHKRIALVPTMGNLHPGHLSLVKTAAANADVVVVSIFVNPLQFGANEDLSDYPRTLMQDQSALEALNVDLLFLPDNNVIYPQGPETHTFVEVPGLSDILCGQDRPGHFRGVATVVAKLFNLVGANVAVFGEKDFQQLTMIKKMVADLALDITIIGVKTCREKSGLALSSRNGYLSATETLQAATLYQTLQKVRQQLCSGKRDFQTLEQDALRQLKATGFRPDYVSIRCRRDLRPARSNDTELVILAAASLGKPRLIDNLKVDL